jgi:hypothetical protein
VKFTGDDVQFENALYGNDQAAANQGFDSIKTSLPASKEMNIPDDNFINQLYDFEPAGATSA